MSARRESGISLRPEEARELLPWFKSGRLSREEDEAIETLLHDSADLRRQLEEIRLERLLPSPNAGRHPAGLAGAELSRLLHQLEHARQRHAAPNIQPSRTPPKTRPLFVRQWVLFLTLLIVLLAVGKMMPDFLGRYAPDLLPGHKDRANPPLGADQIKIVFQPDASMQEIDRLLAEIQARIVSGPEPERTFTLDLVGSGNVDSTIRLLRSRSDLVQRADQRR